MCSSLAAGKISSGAENQFSLFLLLLKLNQQISEPLWLHPALLHPHQSQVLLFTQYRNTVELYTVYEYCMIKKTKLERKKEVEAVRNTVKAEFVCVCLCVCVCVRAR